MKSIIKIITLTFSSVAAVLVGYQSASAQLNVGHYGVQPGLESEYLDYQLSGHNLSQMKVIPECSLGFGLGCNKTGTVLQKLIDSNGGPSYHDLLIRAAGGEDNFRNFASFYGDNPKLLQVPYASFWKNNTPYIMDEYQYVLGQSVSRSPVSGLEPITKNFFWAPLSGNGIFLSPYDGLLNLKFSFGRLLFQQVSKIPNLDQQIRGLGLSPQMTQFYIDHISKGLQALKSDDSQQLESNIFRVLSSPYSPNGGEFGRPLAGISQGSDFLYGQGIVGNTVVGANPITLDPEAITTEVPSASAGDVLVSSGAGASFPYWALAGLPLLLLLIPFGGGDSSKKGSSSSNVNHSPGNSPQTQLGPTGSKPPVNYPPVGCSPSSINTSTGTSCTPPGVTPQPGGEIKKVPEPSMMQALFLLLVVMFIMSNKQRTQQTNV